MNKFFVMGVMLGLALTLGRTERVEAQQLYRSGNCVYQQSVQGVPNRPVGCYYQLYGKLLYAPTSGGAARDEKTGYWYHSNGRNTWIWTTAGWQDVNVNPTGRAFMQELLILAATEPCNQPLGICPDRPGIPITIQHQWTPAEIAAAQGDQRAAEILRQGQHAGVGPWLKGPPEYGRR